MPQPAGWRQGQICRRLGPTRRVRMNTLTSYPGCSY
jgi:hypothetical protein